MSDHIQQLFAMQSGFIGGGSGGQQGGGWLLGLIPSLEGMFSGMDMSQSSIVEALGRILPAGKINILDMFSPTKRGNGLLDKLFRILQLDKIRGGGFFQPLQRNIHDYGAIPEGMHGGNVGNGFVPLSTPGSHKGDELGV